MNPMIALNYYKATIRATLDVGAVFHSETNVSNFNKLNKIQNQALRLAMGYLNSTPIDNIRAGCRENPPNKRALLLVDRFVLKIITTQKNLACKLSTLVTTHLTSSLCRKKTPPPIVDSFCQISNNFGRNIATSSKPPIYIQEYEIGKSFLPEIILSEYRAHPVPLQDAVLQSEIQRKCPGYISIYTDGSKRNDEVGAACLDPTTNTKLCLKLHPATSTYTAEMLAIRKSLNHIEEQSRITNNRKYLILTDCKSAVQTLTENVLNKNPSHLHVDILIAYNSLLSSNISIKITWIKGHEGIKGNQEVDKLANYAAVHGDTHHNTKISSSDVKAYLEKDQLQKLNFHLNIDNRKGLFYKQLFTNIQKRPWFYERILSNRKFIVFFNRLRVNHALCKAYLYKINIETNFLCSLCLVREDMEHIVMECRKYDDQRRKLFQKLSTICQQPFSYRTILLNNKLYGYIHQFFAQCNLVI
ncbi:hypothetical protein WDU94_009842 [Cyamophila willieti]